MRGIRRRVAAGNVETSQRIVDVVFGALGRALPGVVPAASQGTMNNVTIGGIDARTGRPFAYYETIGGGMGGRPGGAGLDAIQTHMTNTLNTPVEALEFAYPLRVERYEIAAGTGGAGVAPGRVRRAARDAGCCARRAGRCLRSGASGRRTGHRAASQGGGGRIC